MKATKVIPKKTLVIALTQFMCPYCEKCWYRGGHKEGFVKSSAMRHVYGCWEVALYMRGYVAVVPMENRGHSLKATPVKKLDGSEPWHKRVLQCVRGRYNDRKRAGVLDLIERNSQ